MVTVLDKHLEINSRIRGGRPHVAGTRVTVDDIVMMHVHTGQSLEDIAGSYDLPLAALYAAMAYYFDHQVEVDRKIAEDDAYVEARCRRNPSKLRAKLKELRGG